METHQERRRLAAPSRLPRPRTPREAGDVGKLAVIGLGQVGLTRALRAATVGYRVVGLDVDPDKAALLRAGAGVACTNGASPGALTASTRPEAIADFDVALITAPTVLGDGRVDLSALLAAATVVARFLLPGATVIVETAADETSLAQVAAVLESGSRLSAGVDFRLGVAPWSGEMPLPEVERFYRSLGLTHP